MRVFECNVAAEFQSN
ncbi:unnamed protein product, partial [Onchocerca ochengi]|uniref:Uncharacterized protein n=1 Tax=Onchocerca ochengi TaxID=42157 RepID=A0A182EZY2_ONCOC